ncbi:MAG: LptF/LptG family permease [Alphaproteobacteria bacterium]
MNKLNIYIFNELLKGFLLIFFIFISIAWLLQFTRLISLSNLLQIDSLTILILSVYLIPNLFTIILPFIVIIGISITFIKLFKDREIISIYSLGLNINVIKKPLIFFSLLVILISIFFNFYFSPNIYEKYKLNEYELRNTINFEKIIFSNFLELNESTIIDFKRNKKQFNDIFINYSNNKENIIYSKKGTIKKEKDKYLFNLYDGFKLTLLDNGDIEKLEFAVYNLQFEDKNFKEYNNFDKNTSNFIEDIMLKDYLNLSYKFYDSLIFIIIFLFFYFYNLKKYKFDIKNILIFISSCTTILIINQIIKNLNSSYFFYLFSTITYLLFFLIIFYYIAYKRSE